MKLLLSVTDEGYNGIEGAVVSVDGEEFYTDKKGKVALKETAVAPSTLSVSVSAAGYNGVEDSTVIIDSEDNDVYRTYVIQVS